MSLQLLIGQAKIFDGAGEYVSGLSEVEKALKEMLKDPDNFQDDLATACFFVWHPGYAEQCYNISGMSIHSRIAQLCTNTTFNLSAEVPFMYINVIMNKKKRV